MPDTHPHYIIGTAGHIDHGKTSLIKALTGINTDRLKEEQERGITIELGFAHFDSPDGNKYGIIDVPGHEKFIPTMLSGAHGFDVVIMVVSADDGVKPQTLEHFEILHLLKVPRAMFVITKIDLASPERVDEVEEEIRILIEGTHLENSNILRVSSVTGEGLDDIRAEISRLVSEGIPRLNQPYLRFPIDRSFTIVGFGTVVTGTVIAGSIKLEDELLLIPDMKKIRVRNIEVHGEDLQVAMSGQRAAINIPRVEKTEITHGKELASPQLSNQIYERFYANLEMLASKACRMKNFTKVRFFKGTSESFVRLINLVEDRFQPKGHYIVDIVFEEPTLVTSGERFIIRDETNRITLGGGEFIIPASVKRTRLSENHIQHLKSFSGSDLSSQVETALLFDKRIAVPQSEIAALFNRFPEELESSIRTKADSLQILPWMGKSVAYKTGFAEKKENVFNAIKAFHDANPEQPGIDKHLLKRTLKDSFVGEDEIELMWGVLISEKAVLDMGEYLKLASFEVKHEGADAEIKKKILALLSDFSANLPKRENLPELINADPQNVAKIFQVLVKSKELIMLATDIYASRKAFEELEVKTIELLKKSGEITIAQFRDAMNTNRNMSVIFLEAMDQRGVTFRKGNARSLNKK